MWKTDKDRTWIRVGDLELSAYPASSDNGDTYKACVVISNLKGEEIAEKQFDDDPSFGFLKMRAVEFMAAWLNKTQQALRRCW